MNTFLADSKISSRFYWFLVFVILAIGIGIRTINFPENPPGLNVDEAVSAYESYALLETGKDKWGHQWPAYFPGWGSGQNVLLAYLTIPFIKVFGLNILSARLTSLILGLLTLPLFFFALRPLGRFTALLGLLLVCLVPWHFMLSRWALESNLLPFFMLLGCTTLSQALITQKKRWIFPALIPFALALYAYGTTIMVLPILFALVFIYFFNQIREKLWVWVGALIFFLLLAFPFLIFFIENHLLKANLAWTNQLFFSNELLPSNRLQEINTGSWFDIISKNFSFLKAGFDDKGNYNLMPGFSLLLPLTVPLALFGLALGLVKIFKTIRFSIKKPEAIVTGIFTFWAIASLGLYFSFELNVNRFNHFYLPALALTAWLLNKAVHLFRKEKTRLMLQFLIAGWFLVHGGLAVRHYFTDYPKTDIQVGFNAGLKEAFDAVQTLPINQIRLTDEIQMRLTYIYALFYLKYPPAEFQQNGDFKIENGMYKVNRFGKYIFFDEFLSPGQPYGYLFRKTEIAKRQPENRKMIYENEFWEVGIINPAAQ